MLDFLKFHLLKQNLHAGSLVYAGNEKTFAPRVEQCAFDEEHVVERSVAPSEDAAPVCTGMKNLVRVVGVHDPELVKRVGQWFGVHPLLLEDAMNLGQRPKIDLPDEGAFVVLKDVAYDAERDELMQEQVSLLLSGESVVAFQENEDSPFEAVLGRIRAGRGRIRTAGPAYLLITLMDAVIDRYFTVLSVLSDRAERLEAVLEERQSEEAVLKLYRLLREVVQLRSILLPTRDILEEMVRSEDLDVSEKTWPYLENVRDHAAQVAEAADVLHQILTSMLDAQVSISGMRMNSVMKLLTLISTIFIPLTFLAGIYGMNFHYIPELEYRYGYHVLMGAMAVIVIIMLVLFRRKKWL